jgi:hypothetical protein
VNIEVTNTDVQVSLLNADLDFFGYMSRTGIVGSYGSSGFKVFFVVVVLVFVFWGFFWQ